jgi:hypothetical protein
MAEQKAPRRICTSIMGEYVYKCGVWWGEVVYSVRVVGDSGTLSEREVN